jgi:hypothetical protein
MAEGAMKAIVMPPNKADREITGALHPVTLRVQGELQAAGDCRKPLVGC